MSIFQVRAKDSIIHLNQFPTLNAIQSFNWDPNFNEEYFSELGNENYSAQAVTPEVSGSFEANAVGATVACMHRMLLDRDVDGNVTGYRFNASTPNTGTIRAVDFEDLVFDLIEAKKPNDVFTRSTLLPHCFLTSWALSVSVDGAARETYSFDGDIAEVYRSPYHDLWSVTGARTTATTITVDEDFYCDVPGGDLGGESAGIEYRVLKVFIDNEEIAVADITADDTAGDAPTILDITASGKTIPEGARIQVIMAALDPGAFPAIYNPVAARFIKADKVNLFLVNQEDTDLGELADGDLVEFDFENNDRLLRVQSIDFNVDLRREVLREIAYNTRNSSVFYRAATYPLNVTANMSVLETDLNDWAKIQDKRLDDMNATFDPADILNLGDFEGKEWQLIAQMWYEGAVIQVTGLLNGRVSGRGSSVAVEGRSEISWNFTGSEIVVEGIDPV